MNDFLKETSLISYNSASSRVLDFTSEEELVVSLDENHISWLNTYGFGYYESFKKVIQSKHFDDFLFKLLLDAEHSNKVIPLEKCMFVAVKVLRTEGELLDTEQMYFIVSSNLVWSVQEKSGDYFQWIRDRIAEDKGIVRRKKADYLLFLILESIVDNYENTFQQRSKWSVDQLDSTKVKPTPEFTALVARRKQELFSFKKGATSLRDVVGKMEKVNMIDFKPKYFRELKEQINDLITDVEFELEELESKINLIFSIQGHRLNEVMKTLTIFSVIFIPLTFLAGLYGMNFTHIPGLEAGNGFRNLLFAMGVIAIGCCGYFYRKKWF